jgi:hypothetical protein
MKRLIVSIKKDEQSEPELLEVPGDEPVAKFLANLVQVLNLPQEEIGVPLQYWLQVESGRLIRDADTLTRAGIRYGTVLLIRSGNTKPEPVAKPTVERLPVPDALDHTDHTEQDPSRGPLLGFRKLKLPEAPRVEEDGVPPATWRRIDNP